MVSEIEECREQLDFERSIRDRFLVLESGYLTYRVLHKGSIKYSYL
jgi:hypothetical protein